MRGTSGAVTAPLCQATEMKSLKYPVTRKSSQIRSGNKPDAADVMLPVASSDGTDAELHGWSDKAFIGLKCL